MSRVPPQPGGRDRPMPVRTCVGCRERASVAELIRIVAVGDGTTTVLAPDLRGGAPGRGAHLHPTAGCLDLAVRRRAFARALRLGGPADTDLVERVVRSGAVGSAHEQNSRQSTIQSS